MEKTIAHEILKNDVSRILDCIVGVTIELDLHIGTGIHEAAKAAVAVANASRTVVRFQFNAVECIARPGYSFWKVVEEWDANFKKMQGGAPPTTLGD